MDKEDRYCETKTHRYYYHSRSKNVIVGEKRFETMTELWIKWLSAD